MGKAKSPDSETLVARQMFLYGEGDGVRITNIPELSDKSGVTQTTLRKWVPKWNDELEEILRSQTKLAPPNSLSVPDEVLENHKLDCDFLRNRMDAVALESKGIADTVDFLERIVDQISQDSNQADKAVALLDKYLRLSMNKKSLDKHFMDLKKMWDDKVGVDSLRNIQEATAKAVSVASAKSEPAETGKEGPRVVNDGVFRKRID